MPNWNCRVSVDGCDLNFSLQRSCLHLRATTISKPSFRADKTPSLISARVGSESSQRGRFRQVPFRSIGVAAHQQQLLRRAGSAQCTFLRLDTQRYKVGIGAERDARDA